MNRILTVVVALAIIALSSTVAIAAGAPKFVRFTASEKIIDNSYRVAESSDMAKSETRAIADAQRWIDANHTKIRIISHSVAGNYTGTTGIHGTPRSHGFSTVTILYEEK